MARNKKTIQNRKKEDTTERFLTRRAELLEICKEKFKTIPDWYVVMCVEAYLKEEFPNFVYDPPVKEQPIVETNTIVEVKEEPEQTAVEAL